jgi:proteasome lid subunit RPN8/RPN11
VKLVLPESLRARIEEEARAFFPRECCGLIEGVQDGSVVEAVALHPARNLATRADRFEIHPEDHFAALKSARNNGRRLVGCYHSHACGSPRPSESDRQGAGEDGFLWLIAALDGPDGCIDLGAFAYFCSSASFSVAELVDTEFAASRAR